MKDPLRPAPARRPVEILLVEDNPGDVTLLRESIKRSRFPIHLCVVEDGEKAIDFLRRREPYLAAPRPDFILLDLNLPRRDGFEVAQEVKRSSRLSGIPTLVLTSSNNDIDRWKAVQHHLDAYLLKPQEWDQYAVLLKYLEENWMREIRPDIP
ncbi:MAG TPA: response regulator [bacterium]|nr:response regulator [bacterium]